MTLPVKLEKEVNCCYFTLAHFALSRLSISPTACAFLEDLLGFSQNKQPFSSVYFCDVIHHVDRKKDIVSTC